MQSKLLALSGKNKVIFNYTAHTHKKKMKSPQQTAVKLRWMEEHYSAASLATGQRTGLKKSILEKLDLSDVNTASK